VSLKYDPFPDSSQLPKSKRADVLGGKFLAGQGRRRAWTAIAHVPRILGEHRPHMLVRDRAIEHRLSERPVFVKKKASEF
jgi:hypothetical protein